MGGAFGHGFLLALALILPLGPQNTFVLAQGAQGPLWRSALPVVVTAALSDTALIAAAVGGASLVARAVPDLRLLLGLAGVVFLVVMGIGTWSATPGGPDGPDGPGEPMPGLTLRRKVRYSLSVSLLNPHAVLDTMVVIGGGSAVYAASLDRWTYAAAAILVSWLWFAALALAGRAIGAIAPGPPVRRWLGRGSALVMWAVAFGYAAAIVRMARL